MRGRVWFVSLLLGVLPAVRPTYAATFFVNDVGNGGDASPGDGICATAGAVCTLRAAIEEANAFAGADDIHFNIAPGGPQAIVLGSALPWITSQVTIDGTTQPGFVPSPPFAPIIELSAAACGGAALDLRGGSSGSTIRGLVINRCNPGAAIRIAGSSNNVIAGNFLGTDLTGTAAGPGNAVGVYIGLSIVATNNNRVGGTAPADRNVISGNTTDGIQINAGSGGAANNVVQGNYIGVDVNGTAAIPNTNQGVALFTSDTNANNVIGGTAGGAGNVISGNGNDGILIANAGTTGTLVQGNRIGTNAAGAAAIPNLRGIEISSSASGNTIGGPLGSQNVISGNTSVGILITGSNNNTVSRALIGTNAAGDAKIANGQHGVELTNGASNNTIGGVSGTGNVISGNGGTGVNVIGAGTSNNSILGNLIGLDLAGNAILSNSAFGVAIAQGATGNIIGDPTGGNVISGNDQAGVRIVDNGTNTNLVQNNIIGLDVTGTLARPNVTEGVILDCPALATDNRIGGAGLGNVISGNGSDGVRILNGMTGTLVEGNRIGTNAAGTAALGNVQHGVQIASGAANNTIGGTAVGLANVISGNGGQGVRIDGSGTTNNVVLGNFIGTDAGVTTGIANSSGGIAITNSAANNTIGGTALGASNVIASNTTYGVNVAALAGTGNAILGNSIHRNTALGIDLRNDGVTANDVGDPDTGPNNLQNFPVLSAAMTVGGNLNIAGSLNSAASTTYRIEFFASPSAAGAAEGERFLGFTNITTDASGNAVFGVTFAAAVLPGENVTATATDPANNTSEFSAAVQAAGFLVVTTTADTVDAPSTASTAALVANPGADGRISLREAILATNATAGADTVRFGIPLSDSGRLYYQNDSIPGSLSVLGTTALPEGDITDMDPDYPAGFRRSWYRIQPTSALPDITDPLVVDGETQPGFSAGAPVVELEGSLAGAGVDGLQLTGGSSTVQGLVINGFQRDGLRLSGPGGYSVRGNYLGTDVSGTQSRANVEAGVFFLQLSGAASTVGGNTPAARNIISGNTLHGVIVDSSLGAGVSSQVRIQGNYVGTDVTGGVGLNAQAKGIYLEFTGGHLIGGSGAGEGNLVSGNAGEGIDINGNSGGPPGTQANNNVIEGNWIGTNAAGAGVIGNGNRGIILYANTSSPPLPAASNNVIRGNVIAGSMSGPFGGNGIQMRGNADDNLIENNFIGTDPTGALDFGNLGSGIFIMSQPPSYIATGNTIRNNVIRFNNADGVRVLETGSSATFTQNQIWSNDGLGIDLEGDGVTANDAGDGDSGANDLLNSPFATAAIESGGMLATYFKLDVPAGSYRVEFFTNPSGADPSGNGEGEAFASSVNVTHPGGGTQNFNHTFPGAVGDVITATTTSCTDGAACTSFGSTSEFSNAVTAVTTAVELISFEAAARNGAIELSWSTGSELDNLGFHLYRSLSSSGPYERITDAVIPGLGSSPIGASYRHTDSGLENGVEYFYKLEDIETTGRTTLHGPVSAVPAEPADDDTRKAYGDPSDVSLRVLERTPRGVLLELVTGGFFGTRESDGTTRLEVPGFDALGRAGAPELPVKRSWLEAVAGRRVSIASVRAFEEASLPGLMPSSASSPEIVASREGTVRATSRRSRRTASIAGVVPESAARVVETGFQGEVKKALLELAPLRWDGSSGRLLWARRLQVRLSFDGIDSRERSLGGSRGRRHRERRSHEASSVVARLTTTAPGLYRVSLGDVLAVSRTRASSLRLSRRGEAVPFHRESRTLYFVGEEDAVYELAVAPGGRTMEAIDAVASGPPVTSYERHLEIEENRYYQAGLIEAPSLWLWDVLVSPTVKSYPFRLGSLLQREARLEVFLQGASDFAGAPDHRVKISVNGVFIGEAVWDGKAAKRFEASLAPGVLRQGENDIAIENVGSSNAAYSMVFLDRFALSYERPAVAEGGVLEGRFLESGTLAVEAGSFVVRTSPETAWLRGAGSGSLRVEAGARYLVVSPEAVLEPGIRKAAATGLRNPRNQVDYLLIGPREFLAAAAPLLERRRIQGLSARAIAIEDVYDDFGFGERGPDALKTFLEFTYHHWASPAPRYVVLFGDATYDPNDYLGTGVLDRVPTLMLKTSYLWTASDPLYAAVNGEDRLPDLAIGRLPAATLEEARVLVEKALAYEDSAQGLSGRAVFVADNADDAGDFESDSDEVATSLAGREVEKIYLRDLGPVETRRAIVDSLDRGASLLSYVGHGGIALWASENVFQGSDVTSLSPQSRQPILMTMNCLNGYFHFPYFDSLGETFVKAENKGAIAAFSPSGLSLNAPAHFFHRALVDELSSGRHARLGDAVLAAQRTYADSGLFPELLAIYHLLGDPALRLR